MHPISGCIHPGSNAAAVTPREPQSSPKWEKTCADTSQTSVRSFTPLSSYAVEKSVTVQENKHTYVQ